MNEPNEVTIPNLVVVKCGTCGSKQVVEQGQQALCQPCVNNFLARNVGIMTPVLQARPEPDPSMRPTGPRLPHDAPDQP